MTNLYDVNLDVTKPRELGGGEWKIRNLTSITVLFGKNGSGKSKLLRQWRSQNAAEYHYVVPERAGEIDYQANHLADQLRSEGRLSQTQRNFSGEYRRQIVARISAYFAARGDHRDLPPARRAHRSQIRRGIVSRVWLGVGSGSASSTRGIRPCTGRRDRFGAVGAG